MSRVPGFSGLGDVPLDYWTPLSLAPQLEEGANLFGAQQPERITIVGRLRHDLDLRQAGAALTTWARQRTADRADRGKGHRRNSALESHNVPLDLMVMAALSP